MCSEINWELKDKILLHRKILIRHFNQLFSDFFNFLTLTLVGYLFNGSLGTVWANMALTAAVVA